MTGGREISIRSPSWGLGCKTKKAVRGDGRAGNQGWGSAQREQLSSLHLTALLDVLPDPTGPCWCPAHLTCLPGTMGLPTCHHYLQSAHLAGTSTLLLPFLVYYLLSSNLGKDSADQFYRNSSINSHNPPMRWALLQTPCVEKKKSRLRDGNEILQNRTAPE